MNAIAASKCGIISLPSKFSHHSAQPPWCGVFLTRETKKDNCERHSHGRCSLDGQSLPSMGEISEQSDHMHHTQHMHHTDQEQAMFEQRLRKDNFGIALQYVPLFLLQS